MSHAAEKLTDASAELEKALAIVLATSQQIPRSDTRLRGYMDRVIKSVGSWELLFMSTGAKKWAGAAPVGHNLLVTCAAQ